MNVNNFNCLGNSVNEIMRGGNLTQTYVGCTVVTIIGAEFATPSHSRYYSLTCATHTRLITVIIIVIFEM